MTTKPDIAGDDPTETYKLQEAQKHLGDYVLKYNLNQHIPDRLKVNFTLSKTRYDLLLKKVCGCDGVVTGCDVTNKRVI